ncbi:DUF1365 domain-containing protein [Thalassotalea sp. Y01]|uniref:DUF1365 domain-containing protein n=1 Tax=Thalassotalea sp. Y01 TaxID=2729613 RepID=UPI001B7D7408|nr:DUF1365 domain-containing protein [Thalassotalea sp. Y01]
MAHRLPLQSQIFRGNVRHRRFVPKSHHFNYTLYMLGLNVNEVMCKKKFGRIFGYSWFNPVRFVESDYVCGEPGSLRQRISHKVAQLDGVMPDGEVMMLVQARCFGLYFSPANFYFCYDKSDHGKCRYMLAEVSNTPWNERHYYLIDLQQEMISDKDFHVSPFMDLAMQYHWRIKAPSQNSNNLLVHIENKRSHGEHVFDATLALKATSLNAKHMLAVWLQLPAMTVKVVAGIYYQALKLFLKRIKFVPYQQGKQQASASEKQNDKQADAQTMTNK